MSRLRVGNISIDGRNVAIDDPLAPAAGVTTRGLGQPGNVSVIRLFDRIPFGPPVLIGAGGVLTAAGTVINVVQGVLENPVAAFLHGGVLAPLGAGLLAVGVAKAYLARRPELRYAASLGSEADAYIADLRVLLGRRDTRQTIGWITERSGWPEARVLCVLALMRSRDMITEDLDPQTGEFFYFTESLPVPRDLDTRLGELSH